MRFSLFGIDFTDTSTRPQPLGVRTPLGDIFFDATIGNEELRADAAHHAIGGAERCVMDWRLRRATVEAALVHLQPHIERQRNPSDCWAAIWRVEVHRSLPPIRLSATWGSEASWIERGPASGQYLDAQEWEDAEWKVLIGTEDSDAVADRARRRAWFPTRYAGDLDDGGLNPVYEANALAWQIPGLRHGDRCQIQFVVAWEPSGDDSIAAWDAVQQIPEFVVNCVTSV